MNGIMYRDYAKRRLFVLDEIALVLAFFSAIFIRYGRTALEWTTLFDGLYVSLIVVAVLLQALIYLMHDYRRPLYLNQETVKTISDIVKSRIVLFILIILYLYMLKFGDVSSRFIIPAMILIDIVYTFILRTLYKKYYISKYGRGKDRTLDIFYPYPDEAELKKILYDGDYNQAVIHTSSIKAFNENAEEYEKAGDEETNRVIRQLEAAEVHPYVALDVLGYNVRNGIVNDIKDYACVPVAVRKEKCGIFGVEYSVARTEEAVLHVLRHIKKLSGKYICFSNVHTLVMAKENVGYRDVLNGSAFTFPDGNPIAQTLQKNGYKFAERIAGPDFMEHMFRATVDGNISHYFYGASQKTLDVLEVKLKEKYPGINIKGMYSPPFRELTEEEDAADIERINAADADIVWIGLGAPKQERWMKAHKGKIKGVMMGVGAGFDFHAGRIKRAPKWIQKIGMEWLYRLFQDPKRLVRRYFVTNVKYFWYSFEARFNRED